MIKDKRLLIGILICLVMFLSAGCETSFPEWSGEMPNETGSHVKPDNVNEPVYNNPAIKPVWGSMANSLAPAGAGQKVRSGSQAVAIGAAEPQEFTATLTASLAGDGSNGRHSSFAAALLPHSAP